MNGLIISGLDATVLTDRGFAAVLAAVLAAVVGLLVVPPSPVSRIHPVTMPPLPPWARAVPGAAPVRTRVLLGVSAGLAVTLAVPRTGWSSLLVGALAGALVSLAAGRLESTAARWERQARTVMMPDVLMLLAGSLEVGAPLRTAVERVIEFGDDPCTQDLRGLHSRISAGVPDDQAWRTLAATPGWAEVGRDVARAVTSGEGVASLLVAHAQEMRTAAAEAAEKRARKVGVNAIVPLVCCHLPAFILLGVVPIIAGTLFKVL